jgi:hypothetical protein
MESLEDGPLAEVWESTQGLLGGLLERGRELGKIRDDLPEDLLFSLIISVDIAHDRWLFDRWDDLSTADIEQAADRIADTLRRLLEPA